MKNVVDEAFRLLRDHCTISEEGRAQFLSSVSDVVERSTLRLRSVSELWNAVWPKPFFAGTRVDSAAKAIDQARRLGAFADHRALCTPAWTVQLGPRRKLLALGSVPERLRADQTLIGPCRVGFRLATAVELAERIESLAQMSDAAVADLQHIDRADFGLARATARPLQAALTEVPGVSDTTAKHILTDLGFPIPKTDIWLCRVVGCRDEVRARIRERSGIELECEDMRFLEARLPRYADDIVFGADLFASEHEGQPEGLAVDLGVSHRRYRFVDLMLSKLGMKPDSRFGLVRSGLDALQADRSLRTKFPTLTELARRLRSGAVE